MVVFSFLLNHLWNLHRKFWAQVSRLFKSLQPPVILPNPREIKTQFEPPSRTEGPSMTITESDQSNQGRKLYLPLAKLSKCAKCDAQDAPDKKLRLCTACGETAYCSSECQKADWTKHKIHCGKTDRVDIQSFYPLLAAIMSSCHIHPDNIHPALTHQIVNDPNPGSGDIIKLPNADAAKLVVLGDPIAQHEVGTAKWWPAAASPRIRSKFLRRIVAEGLLLPIILATAVGLVGEMYTTTALSSSEEPGLQVTGKRRVRLTHNRSPISDIGIIAGTPRVTPQDRLVYYSLGGDFMMGQDPADHYWLYFTTLSGEELYLDCGMYTFNFAMMVDLHSYCQHGLPDIGIAPAFWFGREYQKAFPVAVMDQIGWKPKKRFSILREKRLERVLRGFTIRDEDVPLLLSLMDDIAGRTCTEREKKMLFAFYTNSSMVLRLNVKNREYLNFPKEPKVAIDMDPDEEEEGDREVYQEVHASYLAKLGRKVKNNKITLEQWRRAFEAWTNKPEEARIKMSKKSKSSTG
ncbi:hypothetical protein D9619_013194 [Psilocybe cf. subviscida]|uniref:MYND-type domain-containing protein n=1 Tax=Psilocybe cf. subviscida TaxID=2480587 RepID=A0A8H5B7P1_9AGAR|nr:hypothetical protein D9619_013194 [Psilocybe cf. subviscida]